MPLGFATSCCAERIHAASTWSHFKWQVSWFVVTRFIGSGRGPDRMNAATTNLSNDHGRCPSAAAEFCSMRCIASTCLAHLPSPADSLPIRICWHCKFVHVFRCTAARGIAQAVGDAWVAESPGKSGPFGTPTASMSGSFHLVSSLESSHRNGVCHVGPCTKRSGANSYRRGYHHHDSPNSRPNCPGRNRGSAKDSRRPRRIAFALAKENERHGNRRPFRLDSFLARLCGTRNVPAPRRFGGRFASFPSSQRGVAAAKFRLARSRWRRLWWAVGRTTAVASGDGLNEKQPRPSPMGPDLLRTTQSLPIPSIFPALFL